jgi:sarcosine oxidase, subunit gamma
MSEVFPVTPLNGVSFAGGAVVREMGPVGMITLRAKADLPGLSAAIQTATGCAVPPQRQILRAGERLAGWMSPDEYLLILPYTAVPQALADIGRALAGQHHLAVDVSGARAVFAIEGAAQSVLAKLTPTDFATLPEMELRRTRLAQVAAAFWMEGGGATVVCFASVAQYMFDLLCHAAHEGSQI